MKTIREQLHNFLREQYGKGGHVGWVPSGELQRMVWRSRKGAPATSQNIGRRLRELEEAHAVAVKYIGGAAYYKWLPYYLRDFYRPITERKNNNPERLFRAGVPSAPPGRKIVLKEGKPVYVMQ